MLTSENPHYAFQNNPRTSRRTFVWTLYISSNSNKSIVIYSNSSAFSSKKRPPKPCQLPCPSPLSNPRAPPNNPRANHRWQCRFSFIGSTIFLWQFADRFHISFWGPLSLLIFLTNFLCQFYCFRLLPLLWDFEFFDNEYYFYLIEQIRYFYFSREIMIQF